jgi:hypothetical protein
LFQVPNFSQGAAIVIARPGHKKHKLLHCVYTALRQFHNIAHLAFILTGLFEMSVQSRQQNLKFSIISLLFCVMLYADKMEINVLEAGLREYQQLTLFGKRYRLPCYL